ncbi:MAG: crossover junction endodeoxyribonuclease RuvC [Anaerolineae bacterium]|nr:crossover junction endodeoxyribonuclease RuvC [Anaerolineae bacterium]
MIIGVDPGFTCGLMAYDPRADNVMAHATVVTTADDGDARRIRQIIDALERFWADQGGILGTVAVEMQYAGGRAQSASTIRGPAAVRGAVIAWAWMEGLDVVEVTPQDAKRALVGHGRVGKKQMIAMARARYGVELTEHEADALGMALAAHNRWPALAVNEEVSED